MSEQMCPRCGCGMESGWQYACCAEFPTVEERMAAHRAPCHRFADVPCKTCAVELLVEIAEEVLQ